MMKLSTATGYIYGYVQDLDSGMWQFIMIDFETGETAFSMDVSDKPGYNNMAIGMYAGSSGNALYCPTGYLELLRLQDRFVYLPEMPYRKVAVRVRHGAQDPARQPARRPLERCDHDRL